MSLNSFGTRMPAGIPGAVSRAEHATIEPQVITPTGITGAPLYYGLAGQIDATTGRFRTLANTDTDAYGWLVRPYPTSNVNVSDGLGTSPPPLTIVPVDVMVRGYMTIKLYGTTAAKKGGLVYIYTGSTTGTHVNGGAEAATSSGAVALPDKTYFMGPADADGNVEIAINI